MKIRIQIFKDGYSIVCAELKTFPKEKDLLKVHFNGTEATLLIFFSLFTSLLTGFLFCK